MKILLIDNFDSFTYNIYQLLAICCKELEFENASIDILRNNDNRLKVISPNDYSFLIIGPGPGGPNNTGLTLDVFQRFNGCRPILGICLGHQFLAYCHGGVIKKAFRPMHGKTSQIYPKKSILFDGIPSCITVARYHSLVVEKETLPDVLQVTALSEDGEVMAIENQANNIYGIQFHPESFLTISGDKILKNFLAITKTVHE